MVSPSNHGAAPAGKLKAFAEKFAVLRGAPRELAVVYGQKVVEIVAYQITNLTLVLYLSKDLGYGDVGAGTVIAAWSMGLNLATLFVGSLVDAVGLRRSFLLGYVLCIVGRAVIAFAHARWIAISLGLVPLAVGLALMIPVMTAAVHRYSTRPQRSIAFSLFYTLMNVGFLVGSWLWDVLRAGLGEQGSWTVPALGTTLTTYRTIFLLASVLTMGGMALVWLFLREGIAAADAEPPKSATGNPARIFAEVVREKAFWRFFLFLVLIVGVKLVFYQMHYMFPKYAIREIGPGAKAGTVWGVTNAAIIVALVPIVGALAQRISSYRMIIAGTTVSAAGSVLLVLPGAWFAGWSNALLQSTGWWVHPAYIPAFLFAAVFSVGEAIWSPRLYEYTAAIAPAGRAGSYMALSVAPLFLSKMVAGPLSGWLLQTFCPENGPRTPWIMWAVVSVMAVATPVGIVALRGVIRPADDDRSAAHGTAA